jgi:hypothetical protein
MIPKLTDDAVAELPLGAGRAELLEEIMSTVAPDRPQAEPTAPTRHRSRWLVPLAAAAVVAGIAASSLAWSQLREEPDSPAMTTQLDLPQGQGIVLDAPGWSVDSLGSDGIRFHNGNANLEVTSYDADSYASYVEDREHIVDPPAAGEPIQVLGRPAQMWAYTSHDHTAIREVEDGHWMEFRGDGMDEASYLAVLAQLRLTSNAEFNASLPEDYVSKDERAIAAEQILGEIHNVSNAGFPDGTSFQLADGEAKDRYQFGAEVAGAYACAWLEAFENAKAHGQAAQAAEAARVLGTSRDWPILEQMNAQGDYPEVVWELSDQAVAGQVPDWYREGLGCSTSGPAGAPSPS